MRKLIKRLLNLAFLLFLFFIAFNFGAMITESIKIDQMIEEFKSRQSGNVFQVERNNTTFYYHEVKRVHDYELNDQRNVFNDDNKIKVGLAGDIVATTESPFPFVPVVHQFISAFFGGHAAIVAPNNQLIESTGLGSGGTIDFDIMMKSILHQGFTDDPKMPTVVKSTNSWLEPIRTSDHASYAYYGAYHRNTFFTLRIKYQDINQIDKDVDALLEFGNERVNRALYNYLFVFDTEYKYYCSDLVSRAFEYVNQKNNRAYNLNEDGFITSVQDIIISSSVYITIYKETINSDIHIYYLEDII